MPVDRREFLLLSSAALAAYPFRSLLAQAPGGPATRFEVIRRNVGFFTGQGGHIGWLVNPDAVVVVDSQYPSTAGICLAALKEKSGRGIDRLFNTHHHGDHIAGNSTFRPVTKRIVTHARVPELSKKAAEAPGAAPAVVADATFDKAWSEAMGDETVSATHYGPAHTGGDAVIRFERANVVHMGDVLFHELHPFVDRPAGANLQNWLTVVEAVAKAMPADTVYIAGHSRPGVPVTVGRRELLRQRDYLDAALTHVRGGMAAKRSKEEIVAATSLKGFESHQEIPGVLTLAAVLTAAYEELSAG